MRVVLDTNVFVSGIFWTDNAPAKIIDLWMEKKFSLVSSLDMVKELVETLQEFKIKLDDQLIQSWATTVIENAVMVQPTIKIDLVKEDLDDNKFFEAAVAGGAEFIVSYDRHLLSIGKYQNTRVILPSEFLKFIN
jgi:putative PIN family toxin of toxin-antitoxin system